MTKAEYLAEIQKAVREFTFHTAIDLSPKFIEPTRLFKLLAFYTVIA